MLRPSAPGQPLPVRARVAEAQRGVLHVTEGDGIGPVGDQHGLGFRALVRLHAEKAGPDSPEAGLDAVGDELAEDRVRGQRTVLLDFLGQLIRPAGQGLDPLGQFGLLRALDLHLLLHSGDLFRDHPFLGFGDLELAGQALLLGQDQLVALGQLPELLLQGGGLLGLSSELRLHRGQLLLGDQGLRGAALQLLAQGLDIGLGGGKLLLEIRLLLRKLRGLLLLLLQLLPEGLLLAVHVAALLQFLLESLHLLLALAQQRLLLARRLARPGQFAQQQLAAFVLLLQRQPHHRRQVLPVLGLIGRDVQS